MLYVVGTGCGSREAVTLQAEAAIKRSSIIVGYTVYVDIIKDFFPDKEYISTGMRQEIDRVELALELSMEKTVSLICSGDSELYGMAGLAFQIGDKYPQADIEIVPGVTAPFSGGSLLGSPLTSDFAVISLSDLLTPMEKLLKRLRYAAEADLVIVLYNPGSKSRSGHLKKACDILLEIISLETVCGYVRNIGRDGQQSGVLTLSELRDLNADMFTTIFIGNSDTKLIRGKMVTPRGYRNV